MVGGGGGQKAFLNSALVQILDLGLEAWTKLNIDNMYFCSEMFQWRCLLDLSSDKIITELLQWEFPFCFTLWMDFQQVDIFCSSGAAWCRKSSFDPPWAWAS